MTRDHELERDLRGWMAARPVASDDALLLSRVLDRTERLPQRHGRPWFARLARGPRITGGRPRVLIPAVTLTLVAVGLYQVIDATKPTFVELQ